MKLLCPQCKEQILADNVNMKDDLAFCNECNEAFAINQCRQDYNEFDKDLLIDPPKGCSLRDSLDGTVITVSQRSLVSLIFLLPFTCIWSGFSMWGLYGTQITSGKFDMFRSLFGLPFLLGSLALVTVCLYMMFGRIRISLDGYTLKSFNGIGPFGRRRTVDWSRVKGIAIETSDMQTNNKVHQVIVLTGDFENGKSKVKLLSATGPDNLEFIRSALLSCKKNRGTHH